jgi:hypothetical protein
VGSCSRFGRTAICRAVESDLEYPAVVDRHQNLRSQGTQGKIVEAAEKTSWIPIGSNGVVP